MTETTIDFFFFVRGVKLAIVWFLHTCIFAKYFLWEYPLKYARVIRIKATFIFKERKTTLIAGTFLGNLAFGDTNYMYLSSLPLLVAPTALSPQLYLPPTMHFKITAICFLDTH